MSNVIEFSIKAIDDFSATMAKATDSVGKVEGALIGAAIAAGAYVGIRMARASLDNADAMGIAAQKANMAVESYSALSWAAQQSEVSAGALATGMKFLGRAMAEGESSQAGKAIEALGIAARTATGELRPTIDVLMEVSDAFINAKDDATKTKVAMEIFGRSGVDMVPMLNKGSTAIQQMMRDAEKLGMVISGDFAASANAANDNLDALSAVVSGSVNVAMAQLSPVIEQLTGQMILLVTEGDNVKQAGDAIAAGMKLLVSAGMIVVTTFSAVGKVIGGAVAAMVAIGSGDFAAAADIIKNSTVDLGTNIGETAAKIKILWEDGAHSAEAAAASQARAAMLLKDSLKAVSPEVDAAKKAADALAESQRKIADGMSQSVITYGMTVDQIKVYELAIGNADIAVQQAAVNAMSANAEMTRSDAERDAARKVASENAAVIDRAAAENLAIAKEVYAELNPELVAHAEAMERINIAKASGLITEQEYNLALANEDLAMINRKEKTQNDLLAVMKRGKLSEVMLSKLTEDEKLKLMASGAKAGLEALSASSRAAFNMNKAWSLAQAAISLPSAVLQSFEKGGGFPWGLIPAGLMLAQGAAQIAAIQKTSFSGAAHGGLGYVPSESTYLLDKGERVISPRQNTDLTSFLEQQGSGGGTTIQNLTIHVLENATNIDAFARMDKIQLRNALGQPVIDALNEMFNIGQRPNFAMQMK